MIKFTSFSPKISPITDYYLQFLTQSGKFSLFFLSPYNYANVSYKNKIKSNDLTVNSEVLKLGKITLPDLGHNKNRE